MLGSIKDLQVSMPPEILISQTNIAKAGFMEDKRRAAPDFLTNFDAEFHLMCLLDFWGTTVFGNMNHI